MTSTLRQPFIPLQSMSAFLVIIGPPRGALPCGRRLDEPYSVEATISHALAQRFVELNPEMFGKEHADARAAAPSIIWVGSNIRDSASANPLLS